MSTKSLKYSIIGILLFGFTISNTFSATLEEMRDRLQKTLQQRLSSYAPGEVKISRSLLPKKHIKNYMVPGNSYYEIEFDSTKNGLHYKCDITDVKNGQSMTLLNLDEPYLYVLNCTNNKESSATSNVEKLLGELAEAGQVLDQNVKPGTVKATPRMLKDAMTFGDDTWYYDVTFEDSTSGDTKSCFATVNMFKNPAHSVDQNIELQDCKIIGQKRTPKTTAPLGAVPRSCLSDINVNSLKAIDRQAEVIDKLYDFYESELNKKWPLPDSKDVNCKTSDDSYWKAMADRMISLDGIKLKSKAKQEQELEKKMLSNALINQAYNRLYLLNSKNNNNRAYLQWVGVAAHSSPVVGKSLRRSYVNNVDDNDIGKNSYGLKDLTENDLAESKQNGTIASFFEKRSEVAEMAGKGNQSVYDDMFWQNLAAAYCGPQKVVSLNHQLKSREAIFLESMKNFSLVGLSAEEKWFLEDAKASSDHRNALIEAWSMMNEGLKKKPVDEQLIKEANLKLLWIEQHDTLQPQMYDTKEAKVVHKMGVFNSLAKAGLTDVAGKKLDSFDEYSRKNKQEANLANFENRMDWMKYVVKTQTESINSAEDKNLTKAVFMPALYDSYLLMSDYTK
jgi:hypothetical protein